MKSNRPFSWQNWFLSPEFYVLLAVLVVTMPLVALSISNATTSEIVTMQSGIPTLHPSAPPVVRADFTVCKAATGSCATCHYFIPDNPPGCGGLMRKSAPGDSPHNKTNKPDKPSQAAAELPKPGDVWKAHKDGRPIASLYDIPLPTCFPCPGPLDPVDGPKPAPCTDASCTGSTLTLVADFPPPTCLPCPPADGPMEPIIIWPPVQRS